MPVGGGRDARVHPLSYQTRPALVGLLRVFSMSRVCCAHVRINFAIIDEAWYLKYVLLGVIACSALGNIFEHRLSSHDPKTTDDDLLI